MNREKSDESGDQCHHRNRRPQHQDENNRDKDGCGRDAL